MDGTSLITLAYLIAYPFFAVVKAHAAWTLRELRYRNERTRLEWLRTFGDQLVFDWRTLLWVYLILQV